MIGGTNGYFGTIPQQAYPGGNTSNFQNQAPQMGSMLNPANNRLYAPQNRPTPMLPGRVINNPNDIYPGDIPMDGTVSLFPSADYSCVYAKAWNANGTIDTVKFVRESSNDIPKEDPMSIIMNRLDRIEKMLAPMSPDISQNTKENE